MNNRRPPTQQRLGGGPQIRAGPVVRPDRPHNGPGRQPNVPLPVRKRPQGGRGAGNTKPKAKAPGGRKAQPQQDIVGKEGSSQGLARNPPPQVVTTKGKRVKAPAPSTVKTNKNSERSNSRIYEESSADLVQTMSDDLGQNLNDTDPFVNATSMISHGFIGPAPIDDHLEAMVVTPSADVLPGSHDPM